MRVEQLRTARGVVVAGPLGLTPRVFADDRGFFLESWNQQVFEDVVGPMPFVQDNHSCSRKGVLRGLHYQLPPRPQAKLVRCIVGEIFDVAVDLRRGSASFGQWVGALLSAANRQQLWIPEGFAHGFLSLSDPAEVLYKATDFWSRPCERSLRWDDPTIGVAWPRERLEGARLLLSGKDAMAPRLADLGEEALFR